jgi:hypothetical protein
MRKLVAKAIRSVSFQLLRMFSPRTELEGIQVVSLLEGEAPSGAFAPVGRALTAIRESDPRRFDRVRRYVGRIIVVDVGGASYLPEIRGCFLDAGILARDPLRVAAEIIHESTHGYLFARGFRYTEATRRREELLCVAETLRFLRRTEAGMEIEREFRAGVDHELSLEQPWYSTARQRERSEVIISRYRLPRPLRSLRRFMDG